MIEIRYTPEELKEASHLVLLRMDMKGFSKKIVSVEKCTAKKIYFDKQLTGEYSYRNQLYYEEVGGKITDHFTVETRMNDYYVRQHILIMEKDVERVKKIMADKAKEQLMKMMVDLNKQYENIIHV